MPIRAALAATALLALAAAPPIPAQTSGAPLRLPVRYAADRFFVAPVTATGDTLFFYTDTGGGMNMLFAPVAERLNLRADTVRADGQPIALVPFPALSATAAVPAPTLPEFSGARLAVVPVSGDMGHLFPRDPADGPAADGFLGRGWFADRVWTFDYPGRALWLRAPGDVPAVGPEHRATLGFRVNRSGARTMHFPRIRVSVDGDSLDLLFDTGATTMLTDSALSVIGDGGPVIRGTSFIAQSVVDRWRAAHPGWRVIERAEQRSGMMMIEVPGVDVGGYRVGPVWFTARRDANFHQYMSQWMDRRVDGALGGSALRSLRVTVDYPNAVALFEQP